MSDALKDKEKCRLFLLDAVDCFFAERKALLLVIILQWQWRMKKASTFHMMSRLPEKRDASSLFAERCSKFRNFLFSSRFSFL